MFNDIDNQFTSVPLTTAKQEPNRSLSQFSSGYFSESFDPLFSTTNDSLSITPVKSRPVLPTQGLDNKIPSWESLNHSESEHVTSHKLTLRASLPPDIVNFNNQTANFLSSQHDLSSDFQSDSENAPLMEMDLIPRDLVEERNLNRFPDDPEFMETIQDAQNAIEQGILPELIVQGSSGSYFVRNTEHKVIGVFKPKSEEPYGKMNPKLMKWLHKMCCPCCFGRGCLIPNQGYLSEAAASLVDKKLHLGIVPNTHVVWLASESFNYTKLERAKSNVKKNIMAKTPTIGKKFHRLGLPLKVGSFQTFVRNYKQSDHYLRVFASEGISPQGIKAFQLQFERLVVLDYIIRNTDRGNDNWLIKFERQNQSSVESSARSSPKNSTLVSKSSTATATAELCSNKDAVEADSEVIVKFGGPGGDLDTLRTSFTKEPRSKVAGNLDRHLNAAKGPDKVLLDNVKIAAIDHGLAFPFKHPDSWRMYPYHWVWLPYSKIPFSQETRDLVLPLISDMAFVEELCKELETLYRIDSGFDKRLFERQMSVLRGQILNLSHALKEGKSPLQLVQMPLSVVERTSHSSRFHPDDKTSQGSSSSTVGNAKARIRHFSDQFSQSFHKKKPFFSWW